MASARFHSLWLPSRVSDVVMPTLFAGRPTLMSLKEPVNFLRKRYVWILNICMYKIINFIKFFKVEKVITIMSNPRQYKIPDWFLNRQKDIKDGKYSQVMANILDSKIREDLERLKKIKSHRGMRHFWGYVILIFNIGDHLGSLTNYVIIAACVSEDSTQRPLAEGDVLLVSPRRRLKRTEESCFKNKMSCTISIICWKLFYWHIALS